MLSAAARHGHIDQPALAHPQIPERQRSPMTEHGSRTARERCRHPNAFERELAVPDRIHPSVDPVKLATSDAVLNLIAAHSEPQQLRSRHDPVLRSRQQSHRPIDRRALCGYMPY
jgi:hypothetical protein